MSISNHLSIIKLGFPILAKNFPILAKNIRKERKWKNNIMK